ncbi:MAG TPA: hypothetical protein VFD55_00260 [Candidatus Angelobacter sp.]|nr:hypothetical protein [Candidatus Angelobacter sp.]
MIWLWIVIIIVLFFGLVVFRGAPYVPSRGVYIRQALSELYPLTDKDVLVDIGSGDGIVLREAAKIGARAVGYEINPLLVFISRFLSRKYSSRVSIHFADFWITHLPNDTTVIYIFSVTRDMNKTIKWVQKETDRLGRQINVISYAIELGDKKAVKNVEAYHLYKFYPLQLDKAQV